MVQRDKDRRDKYEPGQQQRREARELEEQQVRIKALEEEIALARRGDGAREEEDGGKEELKLLLGELKAERKKAVELEAELAESLVALQLAEAKVSKVTTAQKEVEQAEAMAKKQPQEVDKQEQQTQATRNEIAQLAVMLERLRLGQPFEGDAEIGRGEDEALSELKDEMAEMERRTEHEEEVIAELERRVEEAEVAAAADAQEGVPIPPPSRALTERLQSTNTSSGSAFAVQRLFKIVRDSDGTLKDLREQNRSLLLQLGGLKPKYE